MYIHDIRGCVRIPIASLLRGEGVEVCDTINLIFTRYMYFR